MWWVMNMFSAVGVAYAAAEGPVEPANFSVADALLQHGIHVSTISGLSSYSPLQTNNSCSIAVRSSDYSIAHPS